MDPRSATVNDREIGHRIREARRAASLSQTDLADKIGVTFQQVQKYEKGTNRVSVGRLHRIADALGVSAMSLLDGSDGKARRKPTSDMHQFLTAAGALRLVRAYERLSRETREALVGLAEGIAKREPAQATTKRRRASAA
jgi:transcriptional regulator with XRE-family HTH domain